MEITAAAVKEESLLMRGLAMDVIFLRALARAGMSLQGHFLAMDIQVTIYKKFKYGSRNEKVAMQITIITNTGIS
jgi:hypothetical protein